jgi:predicted enzyme related to lactoylglutathione lyase
MNEPLHERGPIHGIVPDAGSPKFGQWSGVPCRGDFSSGGHEASFFEVSTIVCTTLPAVPTFATAVELCSNATIIRFRSNFKNLSREIAMADKTVRGRFVWHELMTPDTARAQAFYTRVLGWKTQPWEQDPSYTMFVAASGPLGGTAESSEQSHWLTYVRTDDIEATVEKARELGANVSKEVTEMPNGSRYAVLTDPHGAEFGVYSSTSDPGPESAPKRGEYSWHELATTDYRAAFDFYSALFDWEPAGEHDMGGALGTYFMFGRGGAPLGGIFNRTAEMPGGSAWVGYVRVKDVQQTVKKVSSAGGTVLLPPMEVPGGDWVAQFLDPQGAVFAVHTLAADVKSAATAAPANVEPEAAVAEAPIAESQPKKTAGGSAKAAAKKSSTPAKKAAQKPAKKSAQKSVKKAAKKAAQKAGKKTAKKAAKKAGKKAGKKKASRTAARSKSSSKRRTAARGAKRPARKAAKVKKSANKRSGGKKKAAKRARKAK